MKAVRDGLGTLLLGVVLGFLLTALVTNFVVSQTAATTESPKARAYMLGMLQQNPDTLIALRPTQDVASRAAQFQNAAASKGTVTPLTLTYIGGGSLGRLEVDIYAVEFRANGQVQFWPLALILRDGKVIANR